jgi:hypothetical protein
MMLWSQLFSRAYALAIQCNCYAIVHDLPIMTEGELAGVICFMLRWQDS